MEIRVGYLNKSEGERRERGRRGVGEREKESTGGKEIARDIDRVTY